MFSFFTWNELRRSNEFLGWIKQTIMLCYYIQFSRFIWSLSELKIHKWNMILLKSKQQWFLAPEMVYPKAPNIIGTIASAISNWGFDGYEFWFGFWYGYPYPGWWCPTIEPIAR